MCVTLPAGMWGVAGSATKHRHVPAAGGEVGVGGRCGCGALRQASETRATAAIRTRLRYQVRDAVPHGRSPGAIISSDMNAERLVLSLVAFCVAAFLVMMLVVPHLPD